MEEKNQKIIDGAKQYALYITSNIPQKDEKGNVRYYFSGSLAMLLLSSTESVKTYTLDSSGNLIADGRGFVISEENKSGLAAGVRPLSIDVDVVTLDESTFNRTARVYNTKTVLEKCDLAAELCPAWIGSINSMYLDSLGEERAIDVHDVATITLADGGELLIADPLNLILHKFADAIAVKNNEKRIVGMGKDTARVVEKYEKDVRDFASMFNGVMDAYADIDFEDAVVTLLKHCPQTAFTGVLASFNSEESIEQFRKDAGALIKDKELFNKFIEAILHQNRIVLDAENEG